MSDPFLLITSGYSVLSLVAAAAALAFGIAFAISRTRLERRGRLDRWRERVSPFGLYVAWIVAVLATLGSIYVQFEGGGPPCELGWLQQICIYPLSLLLGIAALSGDVRLAKRYFLALPIAGGVIAAYHYQLEHIAGEKSPDFGLVSCSTPLFNRFGFISVPFMSLAACLLIVAMVLVTDNRDEDYGHDGEVTGADASG